MQTFVGSVLQALDGKTLGREVDIPICVGWLPVYIRDGLGSLSHHQCVQEGEFPFRLRFHGELNLFTLTIEVGMELVQRLQAVRPDDAGVINVAKPQLRLQLAIFL